jgi:hypothetical protein
MSGFMQQQVTNSRNWWRVDGCEGTMFFDAEDFTKEQAAENYEFPQAIDSIELIVGFGARLSAPGYMDCTDWSVYPSLKEAQEALAEMFGDDDDSAEMDDFNSSLGSHIDPSDCFPSLDAAAKAVK